MSDLQKALEAMADAEGDEAVRRLILTALYNSSDERSALEVLAVRSAIRGLFASSTGRGSHELRENVDDCIEITAAIGRLDWSE